MLNGKRTKSFVPLDHYYLAPLRYLFTNTLSHLFHYTLWHCIKAYKRCQENSDTFISLLICNATETECNGI